MLRKERGELEHTTPRLYEAVEKDLLSMEEMLRDRAQKLKARREAVLLEIAGVKRVKEMPIAALSQRRLDDKAWKPERGAAFRRISAFMRANK